MLTLLTQALKHISRGAHQIGLVAEAKTIPPPLNSFEKIPRTVPMQGSVHKTSLGRGVSSRCRGADVNVSVLKLQSYQENNRDFQFKE
jgi:hypothetical protein